MRHQIVQVEQQLRSALSPTYLPNDREKAMQEQQVGFDFYLSPDFFNIPPHHTLHFCANTAIFIMHIRYQSNQFILFKSHAIHISSNANRY